MNDDDLRRLAESRGIALGYHETSGRYVEAPIETLRAIVSAMGDPRPAPGSWPTVVLVRADEPWRIERSLGANTHVRLEDGSERVLPDELPGPLPLGYHVLVEGSRETPLIVVPARAHLPDELSAGGRRLTGLALQLYSLHSRSSWGIGDLDDLAAIARGGLAGDFALLNPLHAPLPLVPQQPSPYFASTRRFADPLAIAVEHVSELALLRDDERSRFDELAAQGRALTAGPLVERDRVLPVKRAALALLYSALDRDSERSAALARFRAATPGLDLYACFCAIVEHHGRPRSWPAELASPRTAGIERFARDHAGLVAFHAYLQLCLDRQRASLPRLPFGYLTDLAVGADPDGFDAWEQQDELAHGMRIGAPPDPLGPRGQDWGLPPAIPHRLVETGFASFVATLRANMRHAAGLRIDHVMGLSRLFWIPPGATAADGTYVHYPARDLFGIVALESVRARCLVIGEDLGTVEPGVREQLAAHGVLSYRLAWFEDRAAADFPRMAMAAVTTHDLPTATGLFSGADLAHLAEIGTLAEGVADEQRAERAAIVGRLTAEGLLDPAESDPGTITAALYAFLARTPCMLRAVSLDDALGTELRPNVPGTIDEHPNWRLRQPLAIEQFASLPLLQNVLAASRGADT